jgi:phage terminase large subunit-like protein
VSSITDNGTGDYTVNFTTALPDANYAALGTCEYGAGGAAQYEYLSKLLVTEGFIVKKDDAVATTSKLKKAAPFFSACENGLVYIVEDSFEKEELELFYRELEIFDGVTRSTRLRHDESIDTSATCFNFLSKQQVLPTIVLPTLTKTNEFLF